MILFGFRLIMRALCLRVGARHALHSAEVKVRRTRHDERVLRIRRDDARSMAAAASRRRLLAVLRHLAKSHAAPPG